jgi:predicted MarR family transcription regulator
MSTVPDSHWVVNAVLDALAQRGLSRAGARFTSQDLCAWLPDLKRATKRRTNATSTLCRLGVVTHKLGVDGADTVVTYTVTAAGAEAIARVAAGQRHRSGPKGPRDKRRVPDGDSFVQRLWTLFRANKLLDADSAASLLVDAGGDVKTAARTARRYFHRWAQGGYAEESTRRVGAVGPSNGFKRYALINDCGPIAPSTGKKAARAEA